MRRFRVSHSAYVVATEFIPSGRSAAGGAKKLFADGFASLLWNAANTITAHAQGGVPRGAPALESIHAGTEYQDGSSWRYNRPLMTRLRWYGLVAAALMGMALAQAGAKPERPRIRELGV